MTERHVAPFMVLIVMFLFVTSLFSQGQISGGVQPVTGPSYSVPDHPSHAEQGTLRPEISLVGGGNYTYAQGERPVWEFGPVFQAKPLGDVAREVRAARAKLTEDEKSQIHWNQ